MGTEVLPEQASEQRRDRFNRGSNQSGMRAYNQRLVLSLVRRHGALSKTEIARMTGLSAQTVSVIMRELETDGLLLRGEPLRGKVGQPSVPMSLAPEGAYFFGLKLGRRSADMALVDFTGRVVGQVHHVYRYPTPGDVVRFAGEAIAALTQKVTAAQRDRVAGLGIAMPFQLWNWAEMIGAPQEAIDAWRSCDIRAEIAALADMPVYVQNDASSACNAELVFGQAVPLRDFLYFYIGFFIGGGVVLNGSLFAGRTGNAGALGSMPVTGSDGATRQLIDVASIASLERMLNAAGHDASRLYDSPDNWEIDAAILRQWIDTAGHGLAYAVLSAASVIDFEAALIDGWMPVRVRADIVLSARRHLEQMNQAGIEPVGIREGTVGYNARALGAATLPLSERFLVDQNAFLKEP